MLLILVLPGGDLIGSILSIAFGAAGLALLLGDEADNAFADIYSAAISLKNVRPGWSTRWLVVSVGAIVLAIALAVDLTQYQNFLFLVGSIFTPLFGVLFADYFLLRRRAYRTTELYPTELRAAPATSRTPIIVASARVLALEHPFTPISDSHSETRRKQGVWYRIPDARDNRVIRPYLGRLSTFEPPWDAWCDSIRVLIRVLQPMARAQS